ncbi:hypothetical protein DMJ13_25790 [halophilic archaeon]|nr:hypothetical protein DMJ13_25790 [halophilic archaeon]
MSFPSPSQSTPLQQKSSTSAESVAETVVAAVGHAEGTDPTSMTPPLYNAINSDALNALYEQSELQVCFQYAGYRIVIQSDQTVEVYATT